VQIDGVVHGVHGNGVAILHQSDGSTLLCLWNNMSNAKAMRANIYKLDVNSIEIVLTHPPLNLPSVRQATS
jgi:hypothetical protein